MKKLRIDVMIMGGGKILQDSCLHIQSSFQDQSRTSCGMGGRAAAVVKK